MNNPTPLPTFLISPAKRLWMLLLTYIAGTALTLVATAILSLVATGGYSVALLRISIVAQDMLMLVLPAIAVAMISTRRPAELLCAGKLPGMQQALLAVLIMIVSAPLMEWVININQNIHLPACMAGLEESLRNMEDAAGDTIEMLFGQHNAANLLLSILIIGVLAGFSEELFFRGALQRILSSTRLSHHAAIWIAAVLFSAVHMQFFGFIPRMLLGAFFGYLLLWSGSIWLPMLAHACNNIMYVLLRYYTGMDELDSASSVASWPAIAISAAFTAAAFVALYNISVLRNRKDDTK